MNLLIFCRKSQNFFMTVQSEDIIKRKIQLPVSVCLSLDEDDFPLRVCHFLWRLGGLKTFSNITKNLCVSVFLCFCVSVFCTLDDERNFTGWQQKNVIFAKICRSDYVTYHHNSHNI